MKRALLVLLASVAVLAVGAPAMAVSWYSQGAPLKATYNGATYGEGYGTFFNENNSYARNSSWRRDPVVNGNSVFVSTLFKFYYTDTQSCHAASVPCWLNGESLETTRVSSSSWDGAYLHDELPSTGQKARGEIKVCEDASLRPDICSVTSLPTFDY